MDFKHPILYDNNIYRKLIGKDNKEFSKNLFKSLNDSISNFYDRFYGLYFPLGLFLEAIGKNMQKIELTLTTSNVLLSRSLK